MPEEQWELIGDYKPWYIGWANDCDKRVSKILEQYYEMPSFLPDGLAPPEKNWIFMGTSGYGANFHVDELPYPTWQAQIQGKKKWSLKSPPECFMACNSYKEFSAVLEEGDMIFVDTRFWYHATTVLDKDLSITITVEYKMLD